MTSLWVGFYLPQTFEGKLEFDWPELEDLNCELARCHSGFGPPRGFGPLGPPRSISTSGFEPPFTDLDSPQVIPFLQLILTVSFKVVFFKISTQDHAL